tara:strand:+ start:18996 stop:19628 length:633 start_codon:yes stop_codon:yes gene_type:complete
MSKKYISICRLYYSYIKCIFLLILLIDNTKASGAYDKGTSTGRGRFELSITYNPMGIVPYGQNYGVLSYGLSKRFDIVGYFSYHQNGTKSQYIGGLYQFLNHKKLDLAAAIGIRHTKYQNFDIFFPQLLYTYKLPNDFSIGGSIVRVIELENERIKGDAIDITLYTPLRWAEKLNSNIKKAYFGFGVFKNTETNLSKDRLYIHYSLDFII